MTEKDAARIMAAVTQDLGPAALAKKLWGIDMKIVELKVLSDDDILEFLKEMFTLIIKWFGSGLAWLIDFAWDVLTGGSPAQPDVSEVTKDG